MEVAPAVAAADLDAFDLVDVRVSPYLGVLGVNFDQVVVVDESDVAVAADVLVAASHGAAVQLGLPGFAVQVSAASRHCGGGDEVVGYVSRSFLYDHYRSW